ncbi:DUF922 domain-containing protein [Parahaliea maris]|uniref:DUF922 domain-containing protein n=1 Tax=Parahaliea maris TaxID=2716870 RepID=UPI001F18A688|nr:DUF922 domain-containing protein [Parahaliea maris]
MLIAAFLTLGGATGCKIQVVAPLGADVVSSSGAFDCRAGTTCTVVVDHPYYYEAFSVEPKPGYAFTTFLEGQGRFCGGSEKPVCGPLNTRGFPGNEGLSALLGQDDEFFLEPEVVADGTLPVDDSSTLKVTLRESVNLDHYPIHGDSVETIQASLYSQDNPFYNAEPVGSGIQVGITQPGYDYSFSAERLQPGSSNCRFAALTIDATITIVMPGLQQRHTLPANLQARWDEFYLALLAHEGGHANFVRDSFEEIVAFFESRGQFSCDTISEEVDAVLEQAAAGYDQRSFDYDVETNHGVFQGVVF